MTGASEAARGPPPGLGSAALCRLRVRITSALGAPDPGALEGLGAVLFEVFARVAGDPGLGRGRWLREGA
eukprot:361931-Alexandrium_andersonii.AAC.1